MAVIGMEQFINDLERMGEKADELMEKALTEGARMLEEVLREAAPEYDGPPRPDIVKGWLKAAIKSGEIRDSEKGLNIVVGPEKGDIGAAYYGKFSEYGTSHEPAKKWARKAFDTNINRIAEAMEQIIVDGIAEFFYGGGD